MLSFRIGQSPQDFFHYFQAIIIVDRISGSTLILTLIVLDRPKFSEKFLCSHYNKTALIKQISLVETDYILNTK